MRVAWRLYLAIVVAASVSCGEDNIADCETGQKSIPCTPRTAEDDARRALDKSPPDYARAIALLEPLVTAEPEIYARHTLLGAAYAGRGGVSILQLVQSQLASDSSAQGSSSLIDSLSSFLPSPSELQSGYDSALADVGRAVDVLALVPVAATDANASYSASAGLQLTLYRSAYSIMYLNKFTISSVTGGFDPALLATMTEADALTILQSLAAAGATSGVPGSEGIQVRADATLAAIQAQDGASNAAKLQAYVEQSQTGGSEGSSLNAVADIEAPT